MNDMIGTPREVGDTTVYDVLLTVTFHIPSLPDIVETYPILLYPDEGGWTAILGLVFETMVNEATPKLAVKSVRSRLTVEVKEEFEEYDDE
jgi:hypothetical protein